MTKRIEYSAGRPPHGTSKLQRVQGMLKRSLISLTGLMVFFAVCSGVLWSALEKPRFIYRFDIGGSCTLTVWSIRRDVLLTWDPDPNPLMVYYRVHNYSGDLIGKTFLEHDDS